MPGQKSSGKNGHKVVSVPASTGTNTSPAAIIADVVESIFPLPCVNILCVFSITTIASSTIIPKPNNKAKRTMKFKVTSEPTIRLAPEEIRMQTNILSGTESATKMHSQPP